jgi:hypothetical protein
MRLQPPLSLTDLWPKYDMLFSPVMSTITATSPCGAGAVCAGGGGRLGALCSGAVRVWRHPLPGAKSIQAELGQPGGMLEIVNPTNLAAGQRNSQQATNPAAPPAVDQGKGEVPGKAALPWVGAN